MKAMPFHNKMHSYTRKKTQTFTILTFLFSVTFFSLRSKLLSFIFNEFCSPNTHRKSQKAECNQWFKTPNGRVKIYIHIFGEVFFFNFAPLFNFVKDKLCVWICDASVDTHFSIWLHSLDVLGIFKGDADTMHTLTHTRTDTQRQKSHDANEIHCVWVCKNFVYGCKIKSFAYGKIQIIWNEVASDGAIFLSPMIGFRTFCKLNTSLWS